MTAMIAAGGASTTMAWVDSSAMAGRLPARSPAQHVWPLGALEVAHIDAFGPAQPHPAGQWLVDVPEQRPARRPGGDQLEDAGRSPLEPAGQHVVGELR